MPNRRLRAVLAMTAATSVGMPIVPAIAQLDEITVTARKKEESLLDVPVVVTAVSREKLERYAVTDLFSLAEITPQLIISEGAASLGGVLALRGISSGTSNSSIEQAVAINVDGVLISNSSGLRFGQSDLQQVEVLKGPQALYFGKNSPGGVISISTADPTDEYEVMGRVGYEFGAEEILAELVLSGPVTDTISVRLAGLISDMNGYFDNGIPPGTPGVVGPQNSSWPNKTEYMGRVTVLFEPNDDLNVRLKYSHVKVDGAGSASSGHLIDCQGPGGTPQAPGSIPAIQVCDRDDRTFYIGDIGPGLVSTAPEYRDGVPYTDSKQSIFAGEVNYQLNENIALTSVTGLYDMDANESNNFSVAPISLLASTSHIDKRDFSEEFRISTSFDSPVNGMLGVYYQDGDMSIRNNVSINFGTPVNIGGNAFTIDTKSVSVFGQLTWEILENLELSGGARWTSEKKVLGVTRGGMPLPAGIIADDTLKIDNISPEVTLTWRPNDDVMVFGAYKQGFKAGGFNTSPTDPLSTPKDLRYNEETAEGFEFGFKTVLVDNSLNINGAVYRYEYDDLQLSTFDSNTLSLSTRNAAAATVKGVELDFVWQPIETEGLTFNGSVNYNHARFTDFINGCYQGQTIALGCDQLLVGGVFQGQDFAGKQLPNAPDWTGAVGASYDRPLFNSETMLGMSTNWSYTGRNFGQQEQNPNGENDAIFVGDATLRFYNASGGWEFAIIARNLTNKFHANWITETPFTGFGKGTAVGQLADITGYLNRSRQIMLRLTLRPLELMSN